MTAHHETAHHDAFSAGRGVFARNTDRVITWFKAFAVSATRRKAIRDLGQLDDRMLADIGLARGDVAAMDRWSLWGDPTARLESVADERRKARR